MNKLACITALLWLLNPVCALPQDINGVRSFSPASPNAVSLGKFGEVPVGLYNGIPEISIPLYVVKTKDLTLPISLDYHASGIKVEDISSWVGLGWSLNAGGVITHSIRGISDDTPSAGFFFTRAYTISHAQDYLSDNINPTSTFDVSGVPNGHADGNSDLGWIYNIPDPEPDVFYFNFGGYSGQFFMDKDGNFVPTPQQDLKIEPTYSSNEGVSRWTVTTPDGVQYVFGESTLTENPPVETRKAIEKTNNNFYQNINLSWYLLEVISPYVDNIKLYYDPESYEFNVKDIELVNVPLQSSSNFVADPNIGPSTKQVSLKQIRSFHLQRIQSGVDELIFITGARNDLPGASSLESIQIKNVNSSLDKTIDLDFGYFNSNGGAGQYYQRLRLNSVEEFAGIAPNRISGGKHTLFYNSTPLPPWDPDGIGMNSQDLWGYNNGAYNPVLTQSFQAETAYGTFTAVGAKRHTSRVQAMAAVLEKIEYPTGGFTAFDFESNRLMASDKDFNFLTAQPEPKRASLVVNSGEGLVYKDFSVVNPDPLLGDKVNMHFTIRQMVQNCPSNPNGFPICFEAYLEGINGTYYPQKLLKEGVYYELLAVGNYRMSLTSNSAGENGSGVTDKHYYFDLDWLEYPPDTQLEATTNKEVGGLRIQRITNYSAAGTIDIKRYEYNTFGTLSSSGVIVNKPQAYANVFRILYKPTQFLNLEAGDYLQVRSYPLQSLSPTKSSPIGYANVTEFSGEYGENGKTEYRFYTASDYPDDIKTYRPYPQPTSYDFRRGHLKEKVVYAYDNATNQFKKIKSILNNYIFNQAARESYGLSWEKVQFCHSYGCGTLLENVQNYFVAGYKLLTEFYYNESETIRTYVPAGSENYLETKVTFGYGYANGHYQLTSKSTRDSDNSLNVINYKHASDLSFTGQDETVRLKLNEKFMRSAVLEEIQTKDGSQLSKTENKYALFSELPDVPLLASINQQVKENPIEQRLVINKYNDNGHVLSQKKVSDFDGAFTWGYNNKYQTSEVLGTSDSNIAFTSFESAMATDHGSWAFVPASPQPQMTVGTSRTGRNYFTIPSGTSIKKSGLTAGTYLVSYWSKNGAYNVNSIAGVAGPTINGWTYYEHRIVNPVSNTVTLTGVGAIDELRLYPVNAQMTTYTYDAAVGVTSKTDPNNVTTYYEYDLLGRQKIVRDTNQKILKTLKYHYKGEQ